MNSPDFDPWEDLADIIMSELLRLQEHPELFSCQNKEEWFWQTVHKLCTDVEFELAPAQEKYDRMLLDLYVTAWEDRFDKALPERDQRRRPWEQFLHNRAPGLNVDLSRYGDGGSVQILPMPAIKIAAAMREENVTIISDIESVSFDVFSDVSETCVCTIGQANFEAIVETCGWKTLPSASCNYSDTR